MSKFIRWVPAIFVMVAIFIASATPSTSLPDYGVWDTLVKKAGHVLGYALLAASFWFGFDFQKNKFWLCWVMAVIYALSDEFHQSFTFGRHPSYVDVFLFDSSGAVLGLLLLAASIWFSVKSKSRTNKL